MVDASYVTLEAEFRAAARARDDQPAPTASRRVPARVGLALIRAYKVAFSPLVYGELPLRPRLRRLHGRGHRAVRRACGAAGWAPRRLAPLPPAWRPRLRSGPPQHSHALVKLSEPRPSMERRVLLAISLSFLVLFVYQTYFAPPPPTPARADGAAPTASGALSASAAPAPRPGRRPRRHLAAPAAPAGRDGETTEREIVVETRTVAPSSRIAAPACKHWQLKHYLNDDGQPLDLVPTPRASNDALAAVLAPAGRSGAHVAAERRAVPERRAAGTSTRTTAPATLAFEWQDAGGLRRAQGVHASSRTATSSRFTADGRSRRRQR